MSLRILGVVALVAACGAPAFAQDGAVLSADQVQRGEAPYRAECSECHGVRFNGGMGPAIGTAQLLESWGSYSAREFYDYVHDAMPLDAPGGLSEEAYTDIVAYILGSTGLAPVGEDAADATVDDLEGITIEEVN